METLAPKLYIHVLFIVQSQKYLPQEFSSEISSVVSRDALC